MKTSIQSESTAIHKITVDYDNSLLGVRFNSNPKILYVYTIPTVKVYDKIENTLRNNLSLGKLYHALKAEGINLIEKRITI
jgi:hypothetical protein